MAPDDGQIAAEFGGQPPAPGAGGPVRVVVDLAAPDGRGPLVKEPHQGADQAGLTLAPFPEQNDVVSRDQRPLEVRQHRLAEPDDARKRVAAGPDHGQQVPSYLLPDPAVFVPASPQFGERGNGRWKLTLGVWLHNSRLCGRRGPWHVAQVTGQAPAPGRTWHTSIPWR